MPIAPPSGLPNPHPQSKIPPILQIPLKIAPQSLLTSTELPSILAIVRLGKEPRFRQSKKEGNGH